MYEPDSVSTEKYPDRTNTYLGQTEKNYAAEKAHVEKRPGRARIFITYVNSARDTETPKCFPPNITSYFNVHL